jgi:streptogramin lyase
MEKGFTSDGLATDSMGRVYLGNLDTSSIWIFSSSSSSLVELVGNESNMTWPDSFTFDGEGNLLFLSDGPAHFEPLDITQINFRVWSIYVDTSAELT